MSIDYDIYIREHKENVEKAWRFLYENLNAELRIPDEMYNQICHHDDSKYDEDEYDAYDAYFYGGNRSFEVVNKFNIAWLKHIHKNPHHWQHWVLIEDENSTSKPLEMPYNYIIEMICDWWAFSFKSGNLSEIFDWYAEHKDKMILASSTRNVVEVILEIIKQKMEEMDR